MTLNKSLASMVFISLFFNLNIWAKGSQGGEKQPPLNKADQKIITSSPSMDMFLLVGQSNMKGRGSIDLNPTTNPRILFFHMTQKEWFVARDPLHALGTPTQIIKSDNAGTGPGLSFAKTLMQNSPNLLIGLLPAAQGGAPISLYSEQGRLYKRSLDIIENAKTKLKIPNKIKAILWLQGEANSKADKFDGYRDHCLNLIDRYRKALKDPELPFIACTIGGFITKLPKAKEINEILLDLPNHRKHVKCVDARDLEGHIGDFVHYDRDSQIEMGKRFARAYLEIIEEN